MECSLFYLQVWGVRDCTLKADNEPAIQALLAEIKKRRKDSTTLESPPPYSHQSNGLVENTVRRVEGVVRSLIFGLKKRLDVTISARSLVLPRIVRHAAFCLTRYALKTDGRSPWARLRGKE